MCIGLSNKLILSTVKNKQKIKFFFSQIDAKIALVIAKLAQLQQIVQYAGYTLSAGNTSCVASTCPAG